VFLTAAALLQQYLCFHLFSLDAAFISYSAIPNRSRST